MSEIAFKAAFYGLGFVGLAGITLIWLRIWQLARGGLIMLWRDAKVTRAVAVAIVPLAMAALYVWWGTIRRVFGCLTDPPCGPNRAAGWINLAVFGGLYLLLEIALLLGRALQRRAQVQD